MLWWPRHSAGAAFCCSCFCFQPSIFSKCHNPLPFVRPARYEYMIFLIFCGKVNYWYATGLDSASVPWPVLSRTSCPGIAVYLAEYRKIYIFSTTAGVEQREADLWQVRKEERGKWKMKEENLQLLAELRYRR